MNFDALKPLLDWLLILGISCSRMFGFCSLSVFFASQYLSGTARRVVTVAFAMLLMPAVYAQGLVVLNESRWLFILILFKEALLGMILGWLTNFWFYAAQSVGFILDTQRGSSMASLFDPLSNSQTSPLGDFLIKFVMVLAVSCGGLFLILKAIYVTYELCPIFAFPTALGKEWIHFFNHGMGTELFNQIALLGGPVLFVLFLAEFGLGLVTRFAPQLNVFFLSMPIKSELSMFFFILYLYYLAQYFVGRFDCRTVVLQFLRLLHE